MDLVNLSELNMSAGTQMRSQIDERVIDEYAEHLRELPPIIVFYDGSRYIPADGFQRIAAYSKCGEKQIPCEVKAGTVRDAILYAAGANATHGRRRTNADKRRAIETLLRDEEWRQKSDRWIADVVKVGASLVGSVRSEMFPPRQLSENAVDNPPQPRRVQSQDGKTRTVPQRAAKPPEPEPEPTVTEEPIAAPRIVRTQPRRMPLQAVCEKVNVMLVQLIDFRDDFLNGLIEGEEMKLAHAASSIDLMILHGVGLTTSEGECDANH
jgi:hypothetical protein